nr:MAG: RNA-dependent RNA polymerase [Drosophila River Almond nege-like virus]
MCTDVDPNAVLSSLGQIQNYLLSADDIIAGIASNALTDTSYREKYNEKILENAKSFILSSVDKPKIKVFQCLSPDLQIKLMESFSMFSLDFSSAGDKGPHAFARAHRCLSHRFMYHTLGVHQRGRFTHPSGVYDMCVKDVGANPSVHLNEGHFSTHSCCPILDQSDVIRFKRFEKYLDSYDPPDDARRKMYTAFKTSNNNYICHSRSEHCHVRAPCVTFLHSSYNIELSDMSSILDAAHANHAIGCFLFSPDVLIRKEGYIPLQDAHFKKFKRNGKLYVRFWFTNDTQNGYTHLFSTYLAIVKCFSLPSRFNYSYVVHTPFYLDNVLFFEIFRANLPYIPSSTPFRVFTTNFDNDIILYYWAYHTVITGVSSSDAAHMSPLRLLVPKVLFNNLYSYAMSIAEGKFTVRNLMVAANSFNTREIISGQNVGVPRSMPPDELSSFVHAMFIVVYIKNYENMKALNIVKADEDRVRELSASSWKRFISPRVRNWITSHNVVDIANSDHNSLPSNLDVQEPESNSSLGARILNFFFSNERKYPVLYNNLVKFITFEDELEEIISENYQHEPMFHHLLPNPLDEKVVSTDKITSATSVNFDEEKLLNNIQKSTNDDYQCVARDLEIRDNAGGGDCLFYSIADAGATRDTPAVIRRRLANSDYTVSEDQKRRLLAGIEDPSDTSNWGEDTDIWTAACEFGCRFCVHSTNFLKNCQLFGVSGEIFHIRHTGSHFMALVKKTPIGLVRNFRLPNIDSPLVALTPTSDSMKVFLDNIFAGTNTQLRKRVKRDYFPLSRLGNGGYISRSALKLREMQYAGLDLDVSTVLDVCGGPGGFTQVMLEETNAMVYGVTLSSVIPYDTICYNYYDRFFECLGRDGCGDIQSKDNQNDIVSVLLSRHQSGVNLVLADGADTTTAKDSLDIQKFFDLMHCEISLALRVLAKNGTFVIKMFEIAHLHTRSVIYQLSRCFKNTMINFLEFSRPLSSEFYVQFEGFKGEMCDYSIDLIDIPKTVNDFFNMLVDDNNFQRRRAGAVYKKCIDMRRRKLDFELNYSVDKLQQYKTLFCRKSDTTLSGGSPACYDNVLFTSEKKLVPDDLLDTLSVSSLSSYLSAFSTNDNDLVCDFSKSFLVHVRSFFENKFSTGSSVDISKVPDGDIYLRDVDRLGLSVDLTEKLRYLFSHFLSVTNYHQIMLHIALFFHKEGYNAKEILVLMTYMFDKRFFQYSTCDAAFVKDFLKTNNVSSNYVVETFVHMCFNKCFVASFSDKIKRFFLNGFLSSEITFESFMLFILQSLVEKKTKIFLNDDVLVLNDFFENCDDYVNVDNFEKTYFSCDEFLKMLSVEITQAVRSIVIASDKCKNILKPTIKSKVKHVKRKIKERIIRAIGVSYHDKFMCIRGEYSSIIDPSCRDTYCGEYLHEGYRKTWFPNTLDVNGVSNNVNGLGQSVQNVTTPTSDTTDKYLAAFEEFKVYLDKLIKFQISNHNRIFTRLKQVPNPREFINNEPGGYGVVKSCSDRYCDNYIRFDILPEIRKPKYLKKFDGVGFVPYDMATDTVCLVSDYSEFAFEPQILHRLDSVTYTKLDDIKFSFVQSAPGCGKTTAAVKLYCANELDSIIICHTNESRDDIIKRINATLPNSKPSVRTFASILLNPIEEVRLVIVDEALMAHSGMIIAAALITQCSEMCMYGDVLQVPFVNRVPDLSLSYASVSSVFKITSVMSTTYRCPIDVAAKLFDEYYANNSACGFNEGIYSVNENKTDTCKVVKITNISDVRPKVGSKILCFTQSDKSVLSKVFKNVSTIHEYQGCQAKDICVVRLSPYDQQEIFLRPAYALVALTRHTDSCVYYSMVTTDALSALIRRPVDAVTLQKCRSIMRGGYTYQPSPLSYASLNYASTFSRVAVKIGFCDTGQLTISNYKGTIQVTYPFNKLTYRISDIAKIFSSLHRLVESLPYKRGDVVMNITNFLNFYDATTISDLLYKNFGQCKVQVDSYVKTVDYRVFDIVNVNCFNELPNVKPFVPNPVVELNVIDNTRVVNCCPTDCQSIQYFLNKLMVNNTFVDLSLDAWMVHNFDLDLYAGKIVYNRTKAIYSPRRFDHMTPVLQTPMPRLRDCTARENLLALVKRNKNVPELSAVVPIFEKANKMAKNFFDVYLDATDWFLDNPITVSGTDISCWLENQPSSVLEKVIAEHPIWKLPLNEYQFSIKRSPKPNLTINAVHSYAALQTIVYHSKDINAVYCVIMREIKNRMLGALKKKYMIFSDMSLDDFENVMNSRYTPKHFFGCETLEIDIGKYDKSQGALALEYECALMLLFGVPQRFVSLWFNAHVYGKIIDSFTGMRTKFSYQRKSGDSATFLFNTMFLMGVLADYFKNFSDFKFALFAGDDSLIYGNDFRNDTDVFGRLYNLEAKFFKYKYPYFCSKFLVTCDDRFLLVPDPLKLFIKLGRSDLVNEIHIKEYFISFCDHAKVFSDHAVCKAVALSLSERYKSMHLMTFALEFLHTLTSFEYFSSLYFREHGALIDELRYNFQKFD